MELYHLPQGTTRAHSPGKQLSGPAWKDAGTFLGGALPFQKYNLVLLLLARWQGDIWTCSPPNPRTSVRHRQDFWCSSQIHRKPALQWPDLLLPLTGNKAEVRSGYTKHFHSSLCPEKTPCFPYSAATHLEISLQQQLPSAQASSTITDALQWARAFCPSTSKRLRD